MRPATLACALALALHTALAALVAPRARAALPAAVRQDAAATRVPPEFNINSGGAAVGRFVAEDPAWIVGETSAFELPSADIGGAEDKNKPMYKSHRYGTAASAWGYDIPVAEPGVYDCTVHFAETFIIDEKAAGAGIRVFDVAIGSSAGKPTVFSGIDLVAALKGAEFTAYTKTVVGLVVPGILSIRAQPTAKSTENAIISGLTCERTGALPGNVKPDYETDPTLPIVVAGNTEEVIEMSPTGVALSGTEVNINAGGPAIGRFIAEDRAWVVGGATTFFAVTVAQGKEIGGAEAKNLPALASHRYGLDGSTWGYVIPNNSPGVYDCSLHFAETNVESFKAGARVFNIDIMDQSLKNVDVYKELNAEFTALVKTFTGLKVGPSLNMMFTPVVGDSYVSAITCEKSGDLTDAELAALNALVAEPIATPGVSPSENPVESPIFSSSEPDMSPVATPGVGSGIGTEVFPTETPSAMMTPSSEGVLDGASLMPTESAEADDVDSDSVDTVGELESLPEGLDDVDFDSGVELTENGFLQSYELHAAISGDRRFSNELMEAIKDISKDSSPVTSQFAVTNAMEDIEPVAGATRSYSVDVECVHSRDADGGPDDTDIITSYADFITDGKANDELANRGFPDVTLSLRTPPPLSARSSPPESNTGTTSKIVAGVVTGLLGCLVLVALLAFFVVRRNRRNDAQAAAFDAPPPPMSESDAGASSVMERSETAASIEYMDDDSTFTAATSRAGGDQPESINVDADLWGRQTS